jgi:hypothetical protein
MLDADDMVFEDAAAGLKHLLERLGWPAQIVWVRPDHIIHFPTQATIVFRPEADDEAETNARAIFRERNGRAAAISFYAAAHDESRTYAFVEALEELGEGEHMFVSAGLKIAAQADATPTYVTRSSIWWWLHRRSYRKWKQRTERALAGI